MVEASREGGPTGWEAQYHALVLKAVEKLEGEVEGLRALVAPIGETVKEITKKLDESNKRNWEMRLAVYGALVALAVDVIAHNWHRVVLP